MKKDNRLTLATVATFDLCVVAWLLAFSRRVPHLIAVTALHESHIERVFTLSSLVSFFAALTASYWRTASRAVLCKMTNLAALLAFYALSGAKLGALLRIVTGLLAITARKWINALLFAVASTMSSLIADDTLDFGTLDSLDWLSLAVFFDVAEFTTIAALCNTAIEWHACTFLETLEIFLGCSWPAFGKEGALCLWTPVEG